MHPVLIIGGTGFIGLNLIEALLPCCTNLVITVRSQDRLPQPVTTATNITIVQCDLKDKEHLQKIIIEYNVSTVLHLASKLIPASSYEAFSQEMEEVILPTFNLLEFLSGKKIKIIYFSSGGTVYGNVSNLIHEDHSLNPISYYGYSKMLIENYITFLNRTAMLPYIILRPSNVYGKYQQTDRAQGFVSVALKKILQQQPIEIWGDGTTIRDYLSVSDLVLCVYKLLDSDIVNETFNIGTGKGSTLLEIIEILQDLTGENAEIVFKEKRKVDVDTMTLAIHKIQSAIDYHPLSLSDGIAKFVTSIKASTL